MSGQYLKAIEDVLNAALDWNGLAESCTMDEGIMLTDRLDKAVNAYREVCGGQPANLSELAGIVQEVANLNWVEDYNIETTNVRVFIPRLTIIKARDLLRKVGLWND